MNCPKCGGAMWDNREKKRNPKAPDFKCKDTSCDGVVWPPRGARQLAPARSTSAPSRSGNGNGGGKEGYWERKEARDLEQQPRIERQSARRDAVAFHALECVAGLEPSLDRVKQIMSTMESWLNESTADADVDF